MNVLEFLYKIRKIGYIVNTIRDEYYIEKLLNIKDLSYTESESCAVIDIKHENKYKILKADRVSNKLLYYIKQFTETPIEIRERPRDYSKEFLKLNEIIRNEGFSIRLVINSHVIFFIKELNYPNFLYQISYEIYSKGNEIQTEKKLALIKTETQEYEIYPSDEVTTDIEVRNGMVMVVNQSESWLSGDAISAIHEYARHHYMLDETSLFSY